MPLYRTDHGSAIGGRGEMVCRILKQMYERAEPIFIFPREMLARWGACFWRKGGHSYNCMPPWLASPTETHTTAAAAQKTARSHQSTVDTVYQHYIGTQYKMPFRRANLEQQKGLRVIFMLCSSSSITSSSSSCRHHHQQQTAAAQGPRLGSSTTRLRFEATSVEPPRRTIWASVLLAIAVSNASPRTLFGLPPFDFFADPPSPSARSSSHALTAAVAVGCPLAA